MHDHAPAVVVERRVAREGEAAPGRRAPPAWARSAALRSTPSTRKPASARPRAYRPVPHPASITSAPAGTPSAISRCTTSPTAPPAGSGTSMSYAHAHDPYSGLEAVEVVQVRAAGVLGLRVLVPRLGGRGVDRVVRVLGGRRVAAGLRRLGRASDPELAHHVVVLVDEVVAVHHVAPGALAGPPVREPGRLLVVALLG